MDTINDPFFDPGRQARLLTEEQVLEYVKSFVDQNCEEKDAAFFKEVVLAGEESGVCTYRHAVQGSAAAQLVYGIQCLYGDKSDAQASEGLFWLIRAANAGSAKAALLLAHAFLQGEKVRQDASRALAFAGVAASQGLPEGAFMLANMLLGTDGIPADQDRAIALLQEAACAGYQPAEQMLHDNGIAFVRKR
jgi:TPR repeat protein